MNPVLQTNEEVKKVLTLAMVLSDYIWVLHFNRIVSTKIEIP